MRITLICLLGSALMANANPGQQAEQSYARGASAEKSGDLAGAQAAYREALRLNPSHANARYRLAQLKIDGGSVAAKGREAKFGSTVIPQIILEGASLQESLDALRLSVEKAAGEEHSPNFIVQDPGNQLQNARITLQLKGVPAKAVLNYILTQASAKAAYDEHAVVISPNRSGS